MLAQTRDEPSAAAPVNPIASPHALATSPEPQSVDPIIKELTMSAAGGNPAAPPLWYRHVPRPLPRRLLDRDGRTQPARHLLLRPPLRRHARAPAKASHRGRVGVRPVRVRRNQLLRKQTSSRRRAGTAKPRSRATRARKRIPACCITGAKALQRIPPRRRVGCGKPPSRGIRMRRILWGCCISLARGLQTTCWRLGSGLASRRSKGSRSRSAS
ncbi:hypothetical protein DFJ73DRAFT_471050 [Zopfochytrium polystomum]|nr:hypothetical protein DFJ73DRAFT_471050 [Zopfochytrium polystomum]